MGNCGLIIMYISIPPWPYVYRPAHSSIACPGLGELEVKVIGSVNTTIKSLPRSGAPLSESYSSPFSC